MHHWVASIGFPVLTVIEKDDGKSILVRQDRFLEDGKPEEKDNQTIWCVFCIALSSIADTMEVCTPFALIVQRPGPERNAERA